MHVLRERHRQAHEHGQDGCRREHEGDGVDGPEMVVHEHGERQQAAADRRDEYRPALEAGTDRTPGWLPCRPGEQHTAADPAQVGCTAGNVRAGCRLEQVETVAHGEDEQAGGDQAPGSADSPAGDREHPHHERNRRQVGERVGEVGRDRGLRAAGRLEHRLEHDGGAHGRYGQPGDDAVEPDASADSAGTRTQQQQQRDVDGRVHRQPKRVGNRRVGRRWQVNIRKRPDRVPDPPGDDRRPDQYPRRTLARARQPARNAHDPGREHKPVVEPIDDEVLHPGVDVDRELERARSECDGDQKQHGARAPTLRENPHTASIDQKSGPGSPYGVDR